MFKKPKELIYITKFRDTDYLNYRNKNYYIKKINILTLNDTLTSLATNGSQDNLNGKYFLFEDRALYVVEYFRPERIDPQTPEIYFKAILNVEAADRKISPRWVLSRRYDDFVYDENNINSASIYSCDLLNLNEFDDDSDELLHALPMYVLNSYDETSVPMHINQNRPQGKLLPMRVINEFIVEKPSGGSKRRKSKSKKSKKTKKTKKLKTRRAKNICN